MREIIPLPESGLIHKTTFFKYFFLLSPAFSKKSGGTLFLVFRGAWRVVRGAWFRVFSRYFVPLTPPTVSVRSF